MTSGTAGPAVMSPSGLALNAALGDWHLSISRMDGREDEAFYAFHDLLLTPRDFARFVPNWRSLTWIPAPDSMVVANESSAGDGDFRMTVSTSQGGSSSHQDAIDAFLTFMRRW